MRGSIPDRWLAYSCYGRTLIDKFVALKVPLSSRRTAVPPGKKFTPEDAIKQLPLGLIIDLTNTKRYYDPCDFTTRGVDHVKVAVPGQLTPNQRIVQRFNDIVNGFFNDPSSNGKLIGVHCTHGLNRTGYLICAYMILELGYNPIEAINLFNAYRGHKMERENYLRSLRSMAPRQNASEPSGHDVAPREHIQSWRQKRRSPNIEMLDRACAGALPGDRERYDPTIRRIVRSREHNFRTPVHRQAAAHEKAKHTRFE
ncbi:RNA/RNP complex-1-interacting phosphatase homolog [Anopheles marshallii]|uniref:RNA/RNP complex-1-interacting phosphatase homolog n=1 Tax=Anopheles marshallii TaxID=1521116 RepID=UPI00237BC768|nr:RNA/RNP complex-1-interacting phosphatase homolog [Anopheles marshallii]